jgi:hypothetical protein
MIEINLSMARFSQKWVLKMLRRTSAALFTAMHIR